MTANERLAEIKARAEAATDGPWDYQPWSQCALPSGDYAESILLANASDDGEIIRGLRDEDGEFIAHARTDVPQLVAALEAVLAIDPGEPTCAEDVGYYDGIMAARRAINEALEVDQ